MPATYQLRRAVTLRHSVELIDQPWREAETGASVAVSRMTEEALEGRPIWPSFTHRTNVNTAVAETLCRSRRRLKRDVTAPSV